jgi:hypothetical protein
MMIRRYQAGWMIQIDPLKSHGEQEKFILKLSTRYKLTSEKSISVLQNRIMHEYFRLSRKLTLII